jgi:hypothetical protein
MELPAAQAVGCGDSHCTRASLRRFIAKLATAETPLCVA